MGNASWRTRQRGTSEPWSSACARTYSERWKKTTEGFIALFKKKKKAWAVTHIINLKLWLIRKGAFFPGQTQYWAECRPKDWLLIKRKTQPALSSYPHKHISRHWTDPPLQPRPGVPHTRQSPFIKHLPKPPLWCRKTEPPCLRACGPVCGLQ